MQKLRTGFLRDFAALVRNTVGILAACRQIIMSYPRSFHPSLLWLSTALLLPWLESPAAAAEEPLPALFSAPQISKIGMVLGIALVLSAVFESAMTPIFNWRVFLSRFEGKGIKTPLTIAVALAVFWKYDIDLVRELLVAMGREPSSVPLSLTGKVLSAFLISGGSQGVFDLLKKLGFRDEKAREQRLRALAAQHAVKNNPAAPTVPSHRRPAAESAQELAA